MALLDYENQMFLELFQDDALVVLAKGLGVERLFVNLVKTYNDPGNLVLVIGTTSVEEEYISQKLIESGTTSLPKIITSEISIKDRYEVYMEGGVLFVSARILVVDMLLERLPIDLVTGVIVYRAHKILESCQEAFAIRLFRLKNKKGFVKAISSSSCAFTRGFAQVQRIMRNLFVKNLFLWPRFHAVVSSSIERAKPEVFELHVPMTHTMTSIQMAVLDLMNVCVKELKRINPSIDTDELSVENAIAKSFDKVIKYQLDPVWHQLTSKTKRLISDLKLLRSILQYLTEHDCVTFYNFLRSLRENINVNTQMSDWLFLDASEILFMHAKERVYGQSTKKTNSKAKSDHRIEENAKWNALAEVLSEISEENKDKNEMMVVIVVNHDSIANQLKEIFSSDCQTYLSKLFKRLLPSEAEDVQKNKKRKLKEDEQTLTQMTSEKNPDSLKRTFTKFPNLNLEFYPLRHSFGNHFRFQNLCDLDHPKYFVLYDGDMEIIRRIELHQAVNVSENIRVYFLIYSGSAEEQSYLTTLRREKEAFEFLIKEKAQMVLPEGIDGKDGDHPDLERGSSSANETVNSKKAGGQVSREEQKIIVDMREFRSELPSLIHRRGIDIVPITLSVGDYILTPEIVVERKSVSDLIGSLNSGRLYSQVQAMCRIYRKPILLIEFDQHKAFSLQGKYYFNSSAAENVTPKLILLTCHFPQLRILWCPSPYTTAEMFELLKIKKEQPNEKRATALKPEDTESENASDKFNVVGCDFLSKLPGVNSKNVWSLARRVKCIADLVNYSEGQFNEILGNAGAAKTLWTSINQEMKTDILGPHTVKRNKRPWKSAKKS